MAGVFPPQGVSAAGALSGVTEDGGSPNVVTVADALNVGTATDANAPGDLAAGLTGAGRLIYDQGTRSITLTDSSGNADVYLAEASGRGVLNGASGLTFARNGVEHLFVDYGVLRPAGGLIGTFSLGTMSAPFNALTLGDGTAQVELGHDGATDGKLVLSDPNSATGAQLVLTDAAGNADVSLSETSGAASLSAPAGVFLQYNGSNRLYARTDGVQVQTNLRPFSAGGASLGSTAAPFDALTLGDGTAQVELGHNGSTDGRLVISDPNSVAGASLVLSDAAGNADVSLYELSGQARLDGVSGVVLSVNSSPLYYATSTEFRPVSAGGVGLGTATYPWGDANVAGTSQAASLGIKSSTEVLSAMSGASASTTNLVPAGCTILYVTARVTTLIEGATTFDIGDGTDVDRYGAAIALAAGTTVDETDGTADPRSWSSSAQDVTLTANGSNFTAGAVRITAFYLDPTPPGS